MCVNLYPFEQTVAERGVADAEVIENIDIGGPTMIRAAAKNFAFAARSSRPPSYDAVLDELRDGGRHAVARHARVARRPRRSPTPRATTPRSRAGSPSRRDDFPPLFVRAFEKVTDLPYGENPHQRAAYYAQVGSPTHLLSMRAPARRQAAVVQQPARPRRGARCSCASSACPACVIVKHNNPCGVALGDTPLDAYRARLRGRSDVAPSAASSASTARSTARSREALVQQFVEVLFAPGYDDGGARDAREQAEPAHPRRTTSSSALHLAEPDVKQVVGGLLVQDRDLDTQERAEMTRRDRSASRREAEWSELLFAWRVCKHVRSNAIVLAQRPAPRSGIGAGQMSRVDSVRIAVEKAQRGLAARARRWPPTRSSRSPTARSWRSRRA